MAEAAALPSKALTSLGLEVCSGHGQLFANYSNALLRCTPYRLTSQGLLVSYQL